VQLAVPRARLPGETGEREWKSALLPAYRRLSRRAELLIAKGLPRRRQHPPGAPGARHPVRRPHRQGAVSRAWRQTRSAWEVWQARDLAGEDIVRLIQGGTVVKVRLDRGATTISLLIALGVRRDGQKVVLAIRNMGGESEAAWRALLDDLLARGLARPELAIVDGGKGLEAALASLWEEVPV
jgi:putative transposase